MTQQELSDAIRALDEQSRSTLLFYLAGYAPDAVEAAIRYEKTYRSCGSGYQLQPGQYAD